VDSTGSEQDTAANICEYVDEPFASIKGGEFPDLLIDYQLLKKEPTYWNYYYYYYYHHHHHHHHASK
jgi:hypothetical protein